MRVTVCILVLCLAAISHAKYVEKNTRARDAPKHDAVKMEAKMSPGVYYLSPGDTLSFTNKGYPQEEKDLIERLWDFKAPPGYGLSLLCDHAYFLVRGKKSWCWMVGFYLTGGEVSPLKMNCGNHHSVTYESTSGSLGFESFVKTDQWKLPARNYSCSVTCSDRRLHCPTTEVPPTSNTFAGMGCDDGICGIKKTGTRIVGGTETEANEYPWQAGLHGGISNFCGASIINNMYIMTAAHCVDGRSPDSFLVTVGQHNQVTDTTSDNVFAVESIMIHADYDSNTNNNDIAIIKLAEPLTFSDTVMPVCAPDQNEDFTGQTGTVTGWGTLSSGGFQPYLLQEVDLPILSNTVCRTLPNYDVITDNMFCAGPLAGGSDSCQGDSGGPLVVPDPVTGLYEQAGVVSWGYGCAAAYQPGVYTNVAAYVDWINDLVSSGTNYCL